MAPQFYLAEGFKFHCREAVLCRDILGWVNCTPMFCGMWQPFLLPHTELHTHPSEFILVFSLTWKGAATLTNTIWPDVIILHYI